MTGPVRNSPVVSTVIDTTVSTVKDVAEHPITAVGDAATWIADKADQYDTLQVGRELLTTKTGAKIIGGTVGYVANLVRPADFDAAGNTIVKMAETVGLNSNVLKGAKNTIGAVAHGAGVAAIAYDAYSSFTDTKADTGSSIAQGTAALAVGAATFIPGIGTGIVVADVLTGGGVTGGVKGLVAWGDAMLTGDHDALNDWKEKAKDGDMGWAIKWAATGEPPGAVRAVGNAIVAADKAIDKGVQVAKDAVVTGAKKLGTAVATGARQIGTAMASTPLGQTVAAGVKIVANSTVGQTVAAGAKVVAQTYNTVASGVTGLWNYVTGR